MDILIGKDGFLFLRAGTNQVLSRLTGAYSLTKKDLDNWGEELESRLNFAKRRGFQYRFWILPDKHCVYPDLLPDGICLFDARPSIQLVENFPQIVSYPVNFFRDLPNRSAYYKTDTHWTEVGMVEWLNHSLSEFGCPPLDYETETRKYTGDLGVKLSPPQSENIQVIRYNSQAKLIGWNGLTNIGTVKYYEGTTDTLPTALVFGDSFFNTWSDIAAQYFSKFYFIHAWCFDKSIIERLNPDIVINENVERFIFLKRNASLKAIMEQKIYDTPFSDFYRFSKYNPRGDKITGLDYTPFTEYLNKIKISSNPVEMIFKRLSFPFFSPPPPRKIFFLAS